MEKQQKQQEQKEEEKKKQELDIKIIEGSLEAGDICEKVIGIVKQINEHKQLFCVEWKDRKDGTRLYSSQVESSKIVESFPQEVIDYCERTFCNKNSILTLKYNQQKGNTKKRQCQQDDIYEVDNIENKQQESVVKVSQENVHQFAKNDEMGSFDKGDICEKVISVKKTKQGKIVYRVEWKEREGKTPLQTKISSQILRVRHPKKIIMFYKAFK